ncbi:hypothetical protein Pfo_010059 [Paulownia fortunei]|nr:hypothetical protein Pfo_010059 [Paulownia fortunei]
MNNKDCSQGFCSLYCPQWCYIIFPPPPPFEELPDESSGPSFSPLVITIIGILAGAFLLVSYYAIISKYCGNRFSSTRLENNHDADVELADNDEPSVNEPWYVTANGLDEALIRSIPVSKYKKGEGLIEGTDCSVCLSEFEEDDSLRLLPKCSHAFHVLCIDTWLKCHPNCPLCRADVAFVDSSTPPIPLDSPLPDEPLSQGHGEVENATVAENVEIDIREEEFEGINVPKTPSRESIDSGSRETTFEIQDDEGNQHIRRSVSMDCICEPRLSIADVLRVINHDEDYETEETNRHSSRTRDLNCVMSPGAMKRSHSSGRWWFSKYGRARNSVIPF